MKHLFAYALVSLGLLSGCATAPSFQKPLPQAGGAPRYVLAKAESTQRTDHLTRHLDDDKTVIYSQNFGGGGAAVGLLLGPLGVMANMSMIESQTKEDAERLKGKLPLSPAALFTEAAQQESATIDAGAATAATALRATPLLRVSKTTETALHLSTVVVVEQGSGAGAWTGRYTYQLPGDYTLAGLAALDEAGVQKIRAQAVTGYRALLAFAASESEASLQAEKKVTFESAFITPRISFEQFGRLAAERDGMVWVRSVQGVYALQKSQVTYKLQAN